MHSCMQLPMDVQAHCVEMCCLDEQIIMGSLAQVACASTPWQPPLQTPVLFPISIFFCPTQWSVCWGSLKPCSYPSQPTSGASFSLNQHLDVCTETPEDLLKLLLKQQQEQHSASGGHSQEDDGNHTDGEGVTEGEASSDRATPLFVGDEVSLSSMPDTHPGAIMAEAQQLVGDSSPSLTELGNLAQATWKTCSSGTLFGASSVPPMSSSMYESHCLLCNRKAKRNASRICWAGTASHCRCFSKMGANSAGAIDLVR